MPIKSLRKIQTDDADLMRVQDAVEEVIAPLAKIPLLDAVLLKQVVVGTAATPIAHGLGRAVVGWFVINKTASVDVWRSTVASNAPTKLLVLQASASTVIDLIVF